VSDPIYQKIYTVVRKIPKGRVATYGQVARLVGIPNPRRIGYALSILSDGKNVPWHRVVNAKGEVSPRWEPDAVGHQQSLLLEEGVRFDRAGRIPLGEFQWQK
jgi:methylated-DNA-protein-cysteine methyltransferase related protein